MIKKFFTMLLIASMALVNFSCDETNSDTPVDPNEEPDVTPEEDKDIIANISYVGALNVESAGVTAYTNDSAELEVTGESDTEFSIIMYEMKFAEGMPVTLDITIPGLTLDTESGDFSAESIIPTVGGAEMAAYSMTNISGNLTDSNLTLNFECYGSEVTYSGTAQ